MRVEPIEERAGFAYGQNDAGFNDLWVREERPKAEREIHAAVHNDLTDIDTRNAIRGEPPN